MSISRWRESRGFSAGAAFVFVVILTALAVAIQATVPMMTSPASQGATAASSNSMVAASASAPLTTTPTSPQSNAQVVAGRDVVTLLLSVGQQVNLYFPVCPVIPPDPTYKMTQAAKYIQANVNPTSNKFGAADGRCKPDPKNPNREVPINPIAWKQAVLYCENKSPTNTAPSTIQPGTTRDITDNDIAMAQQLFTAPGITCHVEAAGTQTATKSPAEIQAIAQALAGTNDPQARALAIQGANLNAADQSALNAALTQQQADITTQNQTLDSANKDIDAKLNALAYCNAAGEANTVSQQAAAGEVADTTDPCQQVTALQQQKTDNLAQIAANQKQLDNLAAAQVALKPPAPPTDPGSGQPVPPGGGQQTPPGGGQQAPGGGQQYPQGGGGPFSNPTIGANNTPQSPFGGACTNRYVCSGNTLYYQTQGYQLVSSQPIVAQQQCNTQPVQQCQYGCQQTNQTGTQSTLGGITAGLQIFSSLSSLLGGGSNNNNIANNNLPSQCAMTPQQSQQQQSPFGTGTNGQPCYQPPQQPDPSQCTAGTWQPTSAQQNGCTTGWQCVPGNGAAGGTPPTAQLSCQPQIADVGMPISFSFACANASGSTGTGFSTGGALSGNATTSAPTPPSGQNIATYTLTCINQGITASAQCQVQLNNAGIVLVTNPKNVNSGDTSLIGWITSGMQSCIISSPDQQDFTTRNAGNTSVNGAATTSPITGLAHFQLDCQTLSGGTKSATTTVTTN